MKQGQETNQIWTQEAGTHDTHDRGLTLLPPPGRRVPRRNSSTGEGGVGALEAPQNKPGQEHRTGTSRAEQTTGGSGSSGSHGGAGSSGGHGGAGSSGGHGGAGSSGGHGRWSSGALASVPSARPLQLEPLLPPQNFLGEVREYQEPSGARHTEQYRTALQGQTDRTGQPTGTASTSTTRGQAARMASMATTRGAACPRRVSVDKT